MVRAVGIEPTLLVERFFQLLFRHLAKRTIEHGNIMLHAKPYVGILIERAVVGQLPICRVK